MNVLNVGNDLGYVGEVLCDARAGVNENEATRGGGIRVSLVGMTAGCGNLEDEKAAVNVRYCPDGNLVVFAATSIDVYDADLGTQKVSIPAPQPTGMGPTLGRVFDLSDDGSVAAVSISNVNGSRVERFSIPSGQKLPAVELGPPPADGPGYSPEDLALSPRAELVYVVGPVGGSDRKTGMFDAASGSLLWAGDGAIMPLFSPDGSTIYLSGKRGNALEGFDAHTGVPSLDVAVTSPLARLAMMPDAHTVIALLGRGCSQGC